MSNMVIAAAKTGNLIIKRKIVTDILQVNKDIRSYSIEEGRHKIIVTRKFKELIIEEIPAKCKEKITKSTLNPAWPKDALKGG